MSELDTLLENLYDLRKEHTVNWMSSCCDAEAKDEAEIADILSQAINTITEQREEIDDLKMEIKQMACRSEL